MFLKKLAMKNYQFVAQVQRDIETGVYIGIKPKFLDAIKPDLIYV